MRAIKLINKILSKYGAQLIRYPSKDMSNRMKLMKHHKINKILDIGANRGSYGVELRNYG